MFRLIVSGGVVLMLLLPFAAAAQTIACQAPLKPMLEIDLMFGRNIGNALGVSETEWDGFVAAEISPRFPNGLSVLEAEGQWRDPDKNAVVHEPSKDVRVIVPQDTETQGKIDAIVAAYKQRFQQQSVGVVIRPACVAF